MKVNLVREGNPLFLKAHTINNGVIGCGSVYCLGKDLFCENCICAGEDCISKFEYTKEMLVALGRIQEEEKVSIQASKEQIEGLIAVLNTYDENYVLPKDLFETIETLKEILGGAKCEKEHTSV